MSRPSRRTRYNRKTAIAKNIIRDKDIDPDTKRLALQVLRLANDDGVIYNDALFSIWQEMGLPGDEERGSSGR